MRRPLTGKQILALVLAGYVLMEACFYLLAGQQFHVRQAQTGDMVTPTADVDELRNDITIEQPFVFDGDRIDGVRLFTTAYDRTNTCTLRVAVIRDAEELAVTEIPASQVENRGETYVKFADGIGVIPGESLTLCITSPDATGGNAVTVYYGSSISVSKGDVEKELAEGELARINGRPIQGILCYQVDGTEELLFGKIYWYLAVAGGIALAVYGLTLLKKEREHQASVTLRLFAAVRRYKFLIEQLVNRDFKAKYKRSVLGMLWSFLNPLLMMTVQYVVFSTLFRSNIPNFPLYLLIGIVCFNFFNESTTMALQSITGNAGLITKVYVPKYIYPVTKVMSCSINLFLSFIPLFLVMLVTRTPLRPQVILILFGILCLEMLCMGVSLLLSTLMVFFRDTMFIWGVLITVLNFATPIFYPESIIPARFMLIYKMNPLYHMVRFMRIVLMNGVSPEPKAYAYCLVASVVPLIVGAMVFKKHQDKFVLYI